MKYEVIAKTKEALKQLGNLIRDRFKDVSGIVYCLSKNECVDVAKFLNKCKIKSVYYHAGLASRQRVAAQKQWHTGEVQVVCATIAFGMGIDKPDVVSPDIFCIYRLNPSVPRFYLSQRVFFFFFLSFFFPPKFLLSRSLSHKSKARSYIEIVVDSSLFHI